FLLTSSSNLSASTLYLSWAISHVALKASLTLFSSHNNVSSKSKIMALIISLIPFIFINYKKQACVNPFFILLYKENFDNKGIVEWKNKKFKLNALKTTKKSQTLRTLSSGESLRIICLPWIIKSRRDGIIHALFPINP